jgi:hypothetical protein
MAYGRPVENGQCELDCRKEWTVAF